MPSRNLTLNDWVPGPQAVGFHTFSFLLLWPRALLLQWGERRGRMGGNGSASGGRNLTWQRESSLSGIPTRFWLELQRPRNHFSVSNVPGQLSGLASLIFHCLRSSLSCLTSPLLLILQVLEKSFLQEAILNSSHPIPYSQDTVIFSLITLFFPSRSLITCFCRNMCSLIWEAKYRSILSTDLSSMPRTWQALQIFKWKWTWIFLKFLGNVFGTNFFWSGDKGEFGFGAIETEASLSST